MGLDVSLGLLVLLAGLRGWFKGFLLQAVQLGALVGCIYLADPVRDLARPYLAPHFPTIRADLFDRLLWWTSAVLSYVLTAGIGTAIIKATRRRAYGPVEPSRGDQGAGFLLGTLKGLVVASFLAAAVVKYSPTYARIGGWGEQQVETSRALALSRQLQPADRIWTSPPVQAFIARVRERGLAPSAEQPSESTPPVQTASRSKTMQIPKVRELDPESPNFLRDFDEVFPWDDDRDWR